MPLVTEESGTGMLIPEELFHQGVNAYNQNDFFEAHELWEELWSDYPIKDRILVQGLIQVAVSFYHLYSDNLKGARSLMEKALSKFQHGIDSGKKLISYGQIDWENFVSNLVLCQKELEVISTCVDFNRELIPEIIFSSRRENE
ncbi:MAG: DUF309 domain-containing protein [Fidelibacterota bacterium]